MLRCGKENLTNAPESIVMLLVLAMYMDDFLKSFATAAEGRFAYSKLSELLATAGMHLTKVFGHADILKSICSTDIGSGNCDLSPGEVTTKALGIVWKPDSDFLMYSVNA